MLQLKELKIEVGSEAFDLDFKSAATTVVLGRNNSGKTNLLRFIAGLSTGVQGKLLLDGEDISASKPQQRPVSLVVQNFVNYPNWSVEENILSPLVNKGISKSEQKKRARQLASTLGLQDLINRMPNELSGGQQQRLAIARALAQDARVLLLDEPFVNLDYKLRETITLELRNLFNTKDTTVIYATSNPRDAFTMGEEVLLLQDQTKLQNGPILDVYRSPKTVEAASLMSDPGVNVITVDHELRETKPQAVVRPEHVYLANDTCSGESERFEFKMSGSETSGDETIIHGSVYEKAWVIRRPGMIEIPARDTIDVFVHKHDLIRFPPEST